MPDVAKLPQRSAWAIGLQGAYVINVEYLCSGGTLGNALAHQARGNVRRQIYFTNAFADAPSWRIIGDDELAAAKARARGARSAELYIFIASEEIGAHAGHKYVLTERAARKLVVTADQSRSKLFG